MNLNPNLIFLLLLCSTRMFGFVAKGIEAGVENVCHVFAEYDRLQPCNQAVEVIQAAIANLETHKHWDNSHSMRP